jgi:hypothetical protein
MTNMRILTVRQPWAWAIVHAGKDIENRTRNIAGGYCGPVAIHAGAAWDWDTRFPVGETPHPTSVSLVRGAIIGVVDLVGVHESRSNGCGTRQGTARLGELIPQCSEWAEPWAHHLVLGNPRPLTAPIPFTGALGLRRLDADVTKRVLAAIR